MSAAPTMTRALAPTSRSAAQLVKACGPAWRAVVTYSPDGWTDETYLGDPRGDGTRPKLTRAARCESEAVRLAGPAGLRAVAVWVRKHGAEKWTADGCWTWTTGEHGRPVTWPREIGVMDLRAVVALRWAPPAAELEVAA